MNKICPKIKNHLSKSVFIINGKNNRVLKEIKPISSQLIIIMHRIHIYLNCILSSSHIMHICITHITHIITGSPLYKLHLFIFDSQSMIFSSPGQYFCIPILIIHFSGLVSLKRMIETF